MTEMESDHASSSLRGTKGIPTTKNAAWMAAVQNALHLSSESLAFLHYRHLYTYANSIMKGMIQTVF